MIAIDNREGKYKSAASALNYGASVAKGDYLVFAHQDIEIFDDRFLETICKHFQEYGPSIIGVAGKDQRRKIVYSNLTHGEERVLAGKKTLNCPMVVSTLDEVLIALPKELFLKYKFDEITCNGWHLYAVDLCLTMGKDQIQSWVIPCDAYHKSVGAIDRKFVETVGRLVAKHRNDYKRILSTCLDLGTDPISYRFYCAGAKLHILMKRIKNNWRNAI